MSISQKKIDVLTEIGAGAIIESTLSKLINIQIAWEMGGISLNGLDYMRISSYIRSE